MSSTVEQVGRVIGGRYRLLAVVGAGASAQVFAADDTRLARRVAVKLLHPALAGDATFLRKFQAEARLARVAQPPQRAARLRLGRRGRDALPGARVPRWREPALACWTPGYLLSPQQAAAVGAEAAQRARLCASPRPCPSRRQAGEPALRRRRPAAAWRTSGWPGRSPRRRSPSPSAPSWGRPATPRPNRSRAGRSTTAPTSTRSR